jgi:hypothetical protein
MYRDAVSSEATYSIMEAALILNKTTEQVELLIKSGRLGFAMTNGGIVINNNHLTNYYLGNPVRTIPEYKPEGPRRKPRKWMVKAKTKR